MQKHTRKFVIIFMISVLILVSVGGLWIEVLKDNLHTVIPGQVYRSAELSPELLQKVIHTKNIKTILNLEGSHANENWYQGEIKLSAQFGIRHYNLELSAHGLPTETQLQQLVNILQTAPRPILIHCHRGADRTGLASAVAIILSGDPKLADARQQYSSHYLVLSPTSVGKLVIPRYQEWLQQQGLINSAQHFLQWVYQIPTDLH